MPARVAHRTASGICFAFAMIRATLALRRDLAWNNIIPWMIRVFVTRKKIASSIGTAMMGRNMLRECSGLIVHVPERSANESMKVR
jgi:hypothetical protein